MISYTPTNWTNQQIGRNGYILGNTASSKQNHEEIENPNRWITSKKTETVIKNFSENKKSTTRHYIATMVNSTKISKKDLNVYPFQTPSKFEKEEMLHFMKPTFP